MPENSRWDLIRRLRVNELSTQFFAKRVNPTHKENAIPATLADLQHMLLLSPVRGSSVGMATRYGLKGPEIESRLGRDFPHPSNPTLGPTQPPVQWVLGVIRPGRGTDYPPPSIAGVKYRVKLYLYSPLSLRGPFEGRL